MYRVRLSNEQLPSVVGYGLLATAEGFYHADRNLPFHVLIYVLEGAIYVTEDGVDYAVQPGQLLFLKSGLRHFGKRQIPRGTRWYYVHFALPQSVPDAAQWLILPKQLSHLTGSSIEKELGTFVEACHSREETTRWYLNQQLFVLLSHIAQHDRPETPSPDLAQRIALYLRQHAREPFRAKELERAFFLSY
ncbi:MAG: cupin domain-containing protein, partial [Clostridiales bacterium]|nr:cupin domain-containing protein [Clostridiales bacterium]